MLARAERTRLSLGVEVELHQMDVTNLAFADHSFDGAVATFLFCVLPDDLQVEALREIGRVVKSGGIIRLLEYVRPRSSCAEPSRGCGSHGLPGPMGQVLIDGRRSTFRRPVLN